MEQGLVNEFTYERYLKELDDAEQRGISKLCLVDRHIAQTWMPPLITQYAHRFREENAQLWEK